MLSAFSPARKQSKLRQHEKPIALAPALFLLVCQVCRWFTAPRPAQTRTGRFIPQRHPLITRRVFVLVRSI
jgi:hypothetical protein